jgi:hypothetical protein
MPEKYDLAQMLLEIEEDEVVVVEKEKKMSQEEIEEFIRKAKKDLQGS